jgi:hypothetical protein
MLLFVALLLAIPTYGLSLLPVFGAIALRARTQSAAAALQPVQSAPASPPANSVVQRPAAQRRAGRGLPADLPSWVADARTVERFRSDLLDALPNRGVPRSYAAAIFSSDETIASALAAAKAAEGSGRDFYRQCFAAADFIVRRWNALPDAQQRQFRDRYL